MQALTMGQLAKQAGVNVETIRYYERRGLLPDVPKRPSGYRAYPPESVKIILFIKKSQDLGFSLREVGELIRLRAGDLQSQENVMRILEDKIQELETRSRDLRRMRSILEKAGGNMEGTQADFSGGHTFPLLDLLEEPHDPTDP